MLVKFGRKLEWLLRGEIVIRMLFLGESIDIFFFVSVVPPSPPSNMFEEKNEDCHEAACVLSYLLGSEIQKW